MEIRKREGRKEEGRQINREGRERGGGLKHFKNPPNSNSKNTIDKKEIIKEWKCLNNNYTEHFTE